MDKTTDPLDTFPKMVYQCSDGKMFHNSNDAWEWESGIKLRTELALHILSICDWDSIHAAQYLLERYNITPKK
jgi:hypothetical protein